MKTILAAIAPAKMADLAKVLGALLIALILGVNAFAAEPRKEKLPEGKMKVVEKYIGQWGNVCLSAYDMNNQPIKIRMRHRAGGSNGKWSKRHHRCFGLTGHDELITDNAPWGAYILIEERTVLTPIPTGGSPSAERIHNNPRFQ